MLPNFMLLSKHVSEEIEVDLVFESADDFDRGHLVLVFPIIESLLDFIQSMLLRQNVIFPLHVLDFLDLANF